MHSRPQLYWSGVADDRRPMPKRLTELDLRRRNCARCTRWKHAVDFPWRWKARGKELQIPHISNVCLVCKSELGKASYNKLSPEEKKARGRRANEQARKRRQRLEALVQERLAAYNKRFGRPVDHRGPDLMLELLPFRMFLLRYRKKLGSTKRLAYILVMDHSRVTRLLNGYTDHDNGSVVPIRQVSLATVDRALVMLEAEERLEDLYPELGIR